MVVTYKIAMIDFTNLTEHGKKLFDNVYKIVEDHFSWDIISQKMVELYQTLVG
jgi:hypothetical protein